MQQAQREHSEFSLRSTAGQQSRKTCCCQQSTTVALSSAAWTSSGTGGTLLRCHRGIAEQENGKRMNGERQEGLLFWVDSQKVVSRDTVSLAIDHSGLLLSLNLSISQ